jgi:hypothetical protein
MQLQLKMGGWIFKPKHLPIAILDKGIILTKESLTYLPFLPA